MLFTLNVALPIYWHWVYRIRWNFYLLCSWFHSLWFWDFAKFSPVGIPRTYFDSKCGNFMPCFICLSFYGRILSPSPGDNSNLWLSGIFPEYIKLGSFRCLLGRINVWCCDRLLQFYYVEETAFKKLFRQENS